MSPHRQRGWLLAQQGRRDLAEREYRMALSDDPNDPDTHALLALLLSGQEDRRADALEAARTAVGLAPDHPFPHYAEARVHLAAERWEAAERAIGEAILLDPYEADHFAVLSATHLGRRRWAPALQAADEGLAVDAGHVPCTNLRATALVHLGRKDEAGATLHGALAHNPENSDTHANQGWALLHRGDRAGALGHFREALRLDPESEWAREGLVEALKARNPLYAGMLRYFLWMQRLDARTRWMVVVGGLLGYNLARSTARANPELAPWLTPLMVAYGVFVLLTWTAPRIFDAVLLASADGRYVLSDPQRRAARWMSAGVAMPLVLVAAAAAGAGWAWMAALLFAALLVPLAATFRGLRARPSRGMAITAAGLYGLGFIALGLWMQGAADAADGIFGITMLGVVITSWVVNIKGQ